MMTLATVIGTRPEFIRASVVSRQLRERTDGGMREVLVNTGQHYDYGMSRVFFDELGMVPPDVDLNVGSAGRARQTAQMIVRLADLFAEIEPDVVVVHGDTNSTLSGALAARCRDIPVAHVEAGLRSGDENMAEEQNRIVTDHLARVHYCPTKTAVENLRRENIRDRVKLIGDLSYDAHLAYTDAVDAAFENGHLALPELPEHYFLVTIHRRENTDNPARLREIVEGISGIESSPFGIFPAHPRTRHAMECHGLSFRENIRVIEPVGFLEMLYLETHCDFIVTDSGGVQKEAYLHEKPCVTVRDSTEWRETVETSWNRLVPADRREIIECTRHLTRPCEHPSLFGAGTAARQLIDDLLTEFA